MNVTAICNQKGGVGKTTTAWMLARHLKRMGRTVLLIDLDPQANLTKLSGVLPNGANISDVLGGAVAPTATLRSACQTGAHDLDIVPSRMDDLENVASGLTMRGLNQLEAMLNPPLLALKRAIAQEGHRWEFCLVDCPPSAGMLTQNAIVVADLVLVPTQPEQLPIDGVAHMVNIVRQVMAATRRSIPMLVFATMVSIHTTGHQQGMEILRQRFGVEFCIPSRLGQDADRQRMESYRPLAERLSGGGL